MNKQYFFSLIAAFLVTTSMCVAIPAFNVDQTPLYRLLEQITTGHAQHQATALMQSITQQLSQNVDTTQNIGQYFFRLCYFFVSEDGEPAELAHIQLHQLRAFEKQINECNAYRDTHRSSSTINIFREIALCNEIVLACMQQAVSERAGLIDHTIDNLVYRPMEFVSERKALTVCCATAVIAGIAYYCFYYGNKHDENNNIPQLHEKRNVRGIHLVRGDITQQIFDEQDHAAIVNAANAAMRGGGGIDHAIHRAAGPGLLQEEIARNMNCPVGQARLTGGHNLAPLRIIHTVGPDARVAAQNAQRADLLNNAYQNSFNIAVDNNIRYIALPSISTGIFQYPIDEAAGIAVDAAIRQQEQHPLDEIRFVTFGQRDFDAYTQALVARGIQQ